MTGRGLMVCGTGSDSGKSTVVAGLCRLLAAKGVKVAPFKAQNMALNSSVTASGHEIGRAQAAQAAAAGVEAEVAMNPVLLKPTGPGRSQVVVNGRPWAVLEASEYQEAKEQLWPVVLEALADLRSRFDVVLCEGAGSPAEINLLRHDLVNLRLAREAGLAAVVVGDIDRGGVFASLFGTVAILPTDLAACIRGFVINKFRGDRDLLTPGVEELEARTGIPVLGVLPWLDGLRIDAEDSLALRRPPEERPGGAPLDVVAIRLPHISNFTDLDGLAAEPGVRVRMVDHPASLGRPDLVVLPGSKATVADLCWLRATGLADAVISALGAGATVLGICGGYQMLGTSIEDPDGVEGPTGTALAGLGLLDAATAFEPEKVTRHVRGRALDEELHGYEIHHGRTRAASPWIETGTGPEGARSPDGAVLGTSVHGLFEADAFRRRFLADVTARSGAAWAPGPAVSFAAARRAQVQKVADSLETHLDMKALLELIEGTESPG